MAKSDRSAANIKVIAERAEVSISTVSRALRANTNVNIETRARILKIAEELGYVPNIAAQALVSGKNASGTTIIGVVYDSNTTMSDHYFSPIIRNIVHEATESGLLTTISSITEHYNSILAFADRLRERLIAGLILIGNIEDKTIELFSGHTPNIVIVDKPSRIVTSISNDNEWGAYKAVSYLAERQFRRIALLESYPGHYFTRSIRNGYRSALEDNGLPFLEELCVDGEYHVTDGYKPMNRLLNLANPPDAVFTNDEMAIGAIKAIKEHGFAVPEDISVFGFDNINLGLSVTPHLSTVGVDYECMARTAVRKIIENLNVDEIVPVQIVIPVQLIHRDSVRQEVHA